MNLSKIISGCAKGDSRYQKLLYEEYYGILMKVAFRYVNTYQQAMELTQNGFLKIFHELIKVGVDQFVLTKENLLAWITRSFIVSLVDHIKSEVDLHIPQPVPEDIWKEYDKPFTDMEMRYIKLIKMLKDLPTLYRLIFNLHVIDGFTHREISGMLGITVEGSKQNLNKVREHFNKSLVGENIFENPTDIFSGRA